MKKRFSRRLSGIKSRQAAMRKSWKWAKSLTRLQRILNTGDQACPNCTTAAVVAPLSRLSPKLHTSCSQSRHQARGKITLTNQLKISKARARNRRIAPTLAHNRVSMSSQLLWPHRCWHGRYTFFWHSYSTRRTTHSTQDYPLESNGHCAALSRRPRCNVNNSFLPFSISFSVS